MLAPDWIQKGQHVKCPYCNCKFMWQSQGGFANPNPLNGAKQTHKNLIVLTLGVLLLIVVTLWFTKDRIQYSATKRWYAAQLHQKGLSEFSFNYDLLNNSASLILNDGTSISSISWSPYHLNCSRSMSVDFARKLIKARISIERFESKQENYKPNYGTHDNGMFRVVSPE